MRRGQKMNLDDNEKGQRFSGAGRASELLCMVILATAWTLQPMPALASVESSESTESIESSERPSCPERGRAVPAPTECDESSGGESFDAFPIDEQLTTAQDPDCPYLRLAVQSPHGSDENYQKALRELLSTSLSNAGFEIVGGDESHYWWASSLALDDGYQSAWTTVVRAVPEIRGGGIQFTTTYENVDGKIVPFFGMQSLRLFRSKEAPEAATQIADRIAQRLLPAAYQRCDEAVLAANREAEAELERVRSELTEEIERFRQDREGGTRLKRLQLQVDTPEQTSHSELQSTPGNVLVGPPSPGS
jgi:hypothetical protein